MERKCNKFKAHIIKSAEYQGNKEYHCVICNKNISRSQCYYHQACANKDERRFVCAICNKKFASSSHLNYHSKMHNEEPCFCSKCGQVMVNSIVLKKHEKLYCKENCSTKVLLHCNLCPKTYTRKSALQQHELQHAEKRFQCNHCSKRFQRNSSLKIHLRRHSHVPRKTCSVCYQKLKDNSALYRHLKLHKEAEKYKCKICSTTTSRKDNMLRHLRNMHNGMDFQNSVEIFETQSEKKSEGNQLDPHYKMLTGLYSSINDNHMPKTIENSSVIKYVGNVKPIKIPKITVTIALEHYQESQEQYDPIEMYRKILTMTDSTEVKM